MSVFTNPAGRSRESAAAYTNALLELLGDRDPLAVLRTTNAALGEAVQGLPDDVLGRPEEPGRWSIRHVLRHLADSDIVWAWRLRLVLAQDRPVLTGYDQDAWAERLGYADADARAALYEFACFRSANLRILERLSDADLARVGVHDERGDESIAHMLKMYAGHDLLHLRQIARIRGAVTA